MKEDDDQPKATVIKFPKFEDKDLIPLVFYKTTMRVNGNRTIVNLQKQVISGVEIPDKTVMEVYDAYIIDGFSHVPKVFLSGKKMQEFLKMLMLNKLRTVKK